METKQLTKSESGIVMPLVSPDQAVEAFDAYQKLAAKIMTADDVQRIGDKEFKKKSFWRKCQRFFNLSLPLVKEWREDRSDRTYTYFAIYRATAPNGAYVDGDGACTNNEKGRVRTEHDTRSTAHTRAKNRAISDLVAFGEVSAEEVDGHEEEQKPPKVEMMTEFQKNRIYKAGLSKGMNNEKLNKYIFDTYSKDWPLYEKITLVQANKIADSLEALVISEDVDPETVEI